MISNKILGLYREYFKEEKSRRQTLIIEPSLSVDIAVGFLDGVSQKGVCRGGMHILKINESHSYMLWMGCGPGSNTRVKIGPLGFTIFCY